jgi:hypothetical protein
MTVGRVRWGLLTLKAKAHRPIASAAVRSQPICCVTIQSPDT